MKDGTRRLALAIGLPLGVLALWLVAAVGLLWATLDGAEREVARQLFEPRVMLLVMAYVVLAAGLAMALRRLVEHHLEAPARLAEQAQAAVAGAERELPPQGSASTRALAASLNALLGERRQLRDEVALRVAEASRGIDEERGRLAALMAELPQSVIVCNLDGRVLLYNERARRQFGAGAAIEAAIEAAPGGSAADATAAPGATATAAPLGLGRSIGDLVDAGMLEHALDGVRQRIERGSGQPTAQFVAATRQGQLLRVRLAPVRGAPQEVPAQAPQTQPAAALAGFVLLLDDIGRELDADAQREQLLARMTEGSRASLGNMQAALEMLDYPDLDAETRERFLRVIRDEVRALGERVATLAAQRAGGLQTRWPLEEMRGADLVAAARARIETRLGLRAAELEVDAGLWLRVDSFSLLQALLSLADRLSGEMAVRTVWLRLERAAPRAHLDLVWSGQGVSTETVMNWEIDAMRIGGEALQMSVRDVVERHDGEFWFGRDRPRQQSFFRFLLPIATPREDEAQALAPDAARPEFYDFDLFKSTASSRELAERPLSELTYTVFDTETTGLEPSAGDRILQIGATRIVNGRLLRHESFEQLVDPQRDIPPAGIPIHGIRPEMVIGQPSIERVLPAFHAFARDTVLVGHNAAFDMRFIELAQQGCGLSFDQPVLDTLLLSAVVHPNQESHSLEAITERLGIAVSGRHTALGDAITTAEIFLRLVPLLAAKGIVTLAQAREAAQQTFYARIKY